MAPTAVGVGDDLDLGSQLVAEPADADVLDGLDTGYRGDDAVDVVDEIGFDAVHEPPVDVASGALEYEEDGETPVLR